MLTIKRENWNGKFVVVARIKGKIQSNIRWSQKNNVERMTNRFRNNHSFIKGTKITRLANVKEIVKTIRPEKQPLLEDIRVQRVPKTKSGVQYQYFIRGVLKDGSVIAVRSQRHQTSHPKRLVREEAIESFLERLAQKFGLDYDANEGSKLFEDEVKSISEGVVQYVPL